MNECLFWGKVRFCGMNQCLGVSSYRGTNIENCTLLQKRHLISAGKKAPPAPLGSVHEHQVSNLSSCFEQPGQGLHCSSICHFSLKRSTHVVNVAELNGFGIFEETIQPWIFWFQVAKLCPFFHVVERNRDKSSSSKYICKPYYSVTAPGMQYNILHHSSSMHVCVPSACKSIHWHRLRCAAPLKKFNVPTMYLVYKLKIHARCADTA
jgi:hypothetical protein